MMTTANLKGNELSLVKYHVDQSLSVGDGKAEILAIAFTTAVSDINRVISCYIATWNLTEVNSSLVVVCAQGTNQLLQGNASHLVGNGNGLPILGESDRVATLRLSTFHAAMNKEKLQSDLGAAIITKGGPPA